MSNYPNGATADKYEADETGEGLAYYSHVREVSRDEQELTADILMTPQEQAAYDEYLVRERAHVAAARAAREA